MDYTRMMLVIVLFGFSVASISAEWHEGGTLFDKHVLDWQEATPANKVATSSEFVAFMFETKMLVSSISSTINSINDLAPHAIKMADCIDKLTKKLPRAHNQRIWKDKPVISVAIECARTMDWCLVQCTPDY